jgi:predicted metal-binding membrane protein
MAGHPQAPLYGLLAGLAALGYVALWWWGHSPWARYLDHGPGSPGFGRTPAGLALFVLGWIVMVGAMMLPTTAPLLESFGRVARKQPRRRRLQLVLVGGFIAVWAAFGYALSWADLALHAVVEAFAPLAERPQLIASALLMGAGIYQFSPLKRQCLSRCRSPAGLILRRWNGKHVSAAALQIGVDYGVSCLGCCWALMTVTFALGTSNVGLMLVFGTAMAIEKNRRVPGLSVAIGLVLVSAGLAVGFAGLMAT